MTWWGGEGVGILGRLFREGSSEKVTRAKGRAAVDEIRGALEIQDLVVLHRTGTFTLSEKVSTAVFCKRDMGWPICYQDHSGCCSGNRLNWGARAAASRPVRRPFSRDNRGLEQGFGSGGSEKWLNFELPVKLGAVRIPMRMLLVILWSYSGKISFCS